MINASNLDYIKNFNINHTMEHFPKEIQVGKGIISGVTPYLLLVVPLLLNRLARTKLFSLPKVLWTARAVVISVKKLQLMDAAKKQGQLTMHILGLLNFCTILPQEYTFLIQYGFILSTIFLTSRSLLGGGSKIYSGWKNRKKAPLDKTVALLVSGILSTLLGIYGTKTLLQQVYQPRIFCSKGKRD